MKKNKIGSKSGSKHIKQKKKSKESFSLFQQSVFYAEEDEEEIDLNKHVGSMRATQPIFGYPLIQFEDDNNSPNYCYQENASWRKFSSSVMNKEKVPIKSMLKMYK